MREYDGYSALGFKLQPDVVKATRDFDPDIMIGFVISKNVAAASENTENIITGSWLPGYLTASFFLRERSKLFTLKN